MTDEQRIEDTWRRWMNSPEGNNSSWLSFEAGWLARDAEVRSADNPDSLRGPTLSAVWFDEVADCLTVPKVSDERLREQFEADAKEALHWSAVSFDREELRPDEYAHGPMQYRWLGWQAAHRSRDAEVQRLVAALTSMVVEFDPNSENEIAAHENAVMLLAEYLPEKEAVDAD